MYIRMYICARLLSNEKVIEGVAKELVRLLNSNNSYFNSFMRAHFLQKPYETWSIPTMKCYRTL